MFPKMRVKYEAFKEETWEQLSNLTVFESSGVPVTTCNGKHSKHSDGYQEGKALADYPDVKTDHMVRKGNSRVLVWPGLFGCTGKLKERKWEVQSFKFLAQEDQAASKDSKMDLSTPIATGLKPNAAGC